MSLRLRLTAVDEFQFLTCLKHQVWGSKVARFKDWKAGDHLALIVDKALAGLAEVSGGPFHSEQRIWDNGVFPHRIPINFVHVILPENRPPILGEIRDVLISEWGPRYGFGILNQVALSDSPAGTVVRAIRSRPNDLERIQADFEHFLAEAKQLREIRKAKFGKRLQKPEIEPRPEEAAPLTKEEESEHSHAESVLIGLGKITGCQVWIASSDRNRLYKGRSLGEGCLKSLPNLGLNEEATKRISLIDVIWLRQNAPACAFEVEATTSVYSGLLRMSDLLTVVPALKMKLFIVAPKDRQTKVMAELGRPTFQKIGLSEYCRFITTEDLDSLLAKVEGLEGHVQPSIVDKIAFELEDELKSGLQ